MIFAKKFQISVIFFVVIVVTLFFGLKPKGYRFINQVKPVPDKNSISFFNIGMFYSEKPLGAIGITDSLTITVSIRPYRTVKRLCKIITVIDNSGDELLSLEQWVDVLLLCLYDTHGKTIIKTGIAALSTDSLKHAVVSITKNELKIVIGNRVQKQTIPDGVIPSGYFSDAYILAGLSSKGRNPFKGEISHLALFNHTILPESLKHLFVTENHLPEKLSVNCRPTAWFDLSDLRNRRIRDISENSWDLHVPVVPKIFKYEILEPLSSFHDISNSYVSDIIINFFGFIPLGIIVCLFFLIRGKTLQASFIRTLITACCITLFIEIVQVFIPTRVSQISDLLLNISGAIAGALMTIFAVKWIGLRFYVNRPQNG